MKANGRPIIVVLIELKEQHGDNPKAQTMDVDTVRVAFDSAKASLEKCAKDASGWKPPFSEWPVKLEELRKLSEQWDGVIWECDDLQSSFSRLRSDDSKEAQGVKNTWHD